ncbi:MAG: acyl-CoA reductase [Chitinophagales bacterium]|nr:acyl-CoA reductase [Chitinophagales bacterium]
MNIDKKIRTFGDLKESILGKKDALETLLQKTEMHNRWFTQFHLRLSLQVFAENYFAEEKLHDWANKYVIPEEKMKTVGLILAGNIPFVGMHDLICVLMSGNKAKIKLSSKDMFFFPYLYQKLIELDRDFTGQVEFVDRLENFDAIIATGSNNSARYFEYYFGKYPNIIRKNRTSIAIISDDDTDDRLFELGKDVFYYFGLGCRNVSKVYLPAGFEVERLFRIWEDYRYVIENNKYKNNYDYNRTLLLLNQTPHLANDFFMMVEEEKLFSPLANLYYEFYDTREALTEKISAIAENLQCVVANMEGNTPFGKTQYPGLSDYADHVDTMEFLNRFNM